MKTIVFTPSGSLDVRCRNNDSGYATPEAIILVAALLALILFLATVPLWPERQQIARVAAAEAARAAILVDDPANGPAVAEATAIQVAVNYGLSPGDVRVSMEGAVVRGETVAVNVSVAMPAIRVPGVGTYFPVEWTARAEDRVEDYRGFNAPGPDSP